jgi:hypothetical protein
MYAFAVAFPVPAAILTIAFAAVQFTKIVLETKEVYEDYEKGKVDKVKVIGLVKDASTFAVDNWVGKETRGFFMSRPAFRPSGSGFSTELAIDTISSTGTELFGFGVGAAEGFLIDLSNQNRQNQP